jgi:hypothetical protein
MKHECKGNRTMCYTIHTDIIFKLIKSPDSPSIERTTSGAEFSCNPSFVNSNLNYMIWVTIRASMESRRAARLSCGSRNVINTLPFVVFCK